MIRHIDTALPYLNGNETRFLPSQRIDFQRFRKEFHDNYVAHEAKEVSALIIWTGEFHIAFYTSFADIE